MFLGELELRNFRNYRTLHLTCSPQVNIFFGQNAQGKTNILEAVALLCLGRSFRTKKETELIGWGEETCFLRGFFQTDLISKEIEIGIGDREKRVKIDKQVVKSSLLMGQVPVVIFAPDDLQLIKGGPGQRRDYLDLYLAQLDPKYRFVFYNYYKVLQQRNKLLKEGRVNSTELEVWDEQLIEKGSKVIKYRVKLIQSIQPFIAKAQFQISGEVENLAITYMSFGNLPIASTEESEIQAQFRREIGKWRQIEIDRGMTLVGPQRDDLQLTIGDGIELRHFGSQGQQRTAALALKLGLVEKINEIRGESPIVLLDDVMSEFDDERKGHLLQLLVSSSQTFMTSTSRRDFPVADQQTRFFAVHKGVITSDGF